MEQRGGGARGELLGPHRGVPRIGQRPAEVGVRVVDEVRRREREGGVDDEHFRGDQQRGGTRREIQHAQAEDFGAVDDVVGHEERLGGVVAHVEETEVPDSIEHVSCSRSDAVRAEHDRHEELGRRTRSDVQLDYLLNRGTIGLSRWSEGPQHDPLPRDDQIAKSARCGWVRRAERARSCCRAQGQRKRRSPVIESSPDVSVAGRVVELERNFPVWERVQGHCSG